MGSATPSVQSYYEVTHGQGHLLTLHQRAKQQPLPEVEIVNMAREFQSGNRSMFSQALLQTMEDSLSHGEMCIRDSALTAAVGVALKGFNFAVGAAHLVPVGDSTAVNAAHLLTGQVVYWVCLLYTSCLIRIRSLECEPLRRSKPYPCITDR